MIKIEYLEEEIPVYDITVKDNHNFFGNGILLHNCSEIVLSTDEDRTAVCCLSSLNLEYYEEWRDTNLVQDLITMLDNTLDYFINNAPDELKKAKYSALRERSIGLGAMGFHSLLQRKDIPFESDVADSYNRIIFADIKNKSVQQSKALAISRGEALDMVGTGMRHAHLLAIAPNANSSIIADTSPSIEPYHANAFVHRTRAGSYLVKNKYLEMILDSLDQNNETTWSSIISHNGSVAHLDFISDRIKKVFRTAIEIEQKWIIQHAATRQKYICQAQSVNLFFHSNADRAQVNQIHLSAWQQGLKSLYYLRTETGYKAESIGNKVAEQKLVILEKSQDECEACMV